MATHKIAVTIEEKTLKRVDELVKSGFFANRSKAFQGALEEKISRVDKLGLARESAKLNKTEEKELAEEGIFIDGEEWPKY